MSEATIPIPQIGLIAATRGMLGAGIGLLLSGRMEPNVRKAVGATLCAVGVVTTIPLAMMVFGSRKQNAARARHAGSKPHTVTRPPEIVEDDPLVPIGTS
jgi:hypothetical protein